MPGLRLAVFVLVVVLLTSCATTPPSRTVDTIDIVTLNLWHDSHDWPRREAMIVAELRRLDPDVIVLQEVLQDTGVPNQAQALAVQLGYAWHFVSVDPPGRVRRYGNAILTREAPLQRDQRALQPIDDYRIAGWVRVDVRGRALNVYAAHLNFTDRSGATRARQVEDLLAFVAATRGVAPVVIAGDFNTTSDAPELAALQRSFIDAYAATHGGQGVETPEHSTLNPRFNPPARIDHVFLERDSLRPLQSRRILDEAGADGAWASDHYGVWARAAR